MSKYWKAFSKEFDIFRKNKLDESVILERENRDLYISNRVTNNKNWLRLNEKYFEKELEDAGYGISEVFELKWTHLPEIRRGNNYKSVLEFNSLIK